MVNAAGPWVDHVRRLEDPRAGTSVRLSKGVHVLVPTEEEWTAALTIAQDDVRVTFAVPWSGMLLLGTTDQLHEGEPGEAVVDPADVAQVLREAAVALEPALVSPDRVRAVYAGLRVLPTGAGGSASARRETVFTRSPGGMLNVSGGSSRRTAGSRSRHFTACARISDCTVWRRTRGRSPVRRGSTSCPSLLISTRSSRDIFGSSTAASRQRFSRRQRTNLPSSSAFTPAVPTSPHRRDTRRRTSGREAQRT